MPVEIYIALLIRYRDALYPEGQPLLSVSADWIARCGIPQLISAGSDKFHPERLVRYILDIAPTASRLPATMAD